jgi:hypothetical protein
VTFKYFAVIHERGSPETLRDPRGFAVKFYTREGNFDMVGNNMPVSTAGAMLTAGYGLTVGAAVLQYCKLHSTNAHTLIITVLVLLYLQVSMSVMDGRLALGATD